MNFSVNCHLTASYLSDNHYWPKTSKWEPPNICEFNGAYWKHSSKFRTPFHEFLK